MTGRRHADRRHVPGVKNESMQPGHGAVRMALFVLMALLGMLSELAAAEQTTIIVAKDGSGDFTAIQDAVNSVPLRHTERVTIIVKNGVYREKLYIVTSGLTIVGEDRDSTVIVCAELRKNWNRERFGVDWGAAVVNIDSSVTDLAIANLTIYNNYGALHGTTDHQFAIRGGGTRIMLLDCNVIADGGDTVSLWNRQSGMYYHAGCYFEGYVDFVCPRGWCYITDSRFFGRNLNASIWHDGSNAKEQKFVMRRCVFDGVDSFALGRNHRDGQFFLLECTFSPRMKDQPIYRPDSSPSPNVWGPRYYFYRCRRESGNYPWFADNLAEAEDAPWPDQIDAKWTFHGRWDPESEIARVLPNGYRPSPMPARMPLGIQERIR